MPPSELRAKLRALRGHLRRLILLAGASRLVVLLVAALALCLALDWSAKLEAPGRAMLLAATGAFALTALWRLLILPLRVRLGDEELALLIERRFPALGDRLISTVQLARLGDVAPLSRAMVQQLTHDTLAQTHPLDFNDVAATRPSALWAVGAAVTLVAASLYTLWFPATTAIFAARFLDPFSTIEWPRRTQLSVLAYDKDSHQLALDGNRIFVPKGEDLHLVVRAARHSGKIWRPPRRVAVRYRFEAGGTGRRNVPMGDQATYRTAFPTVTENFSFAVTGDDATTRPYRVQVRDRPRIEDIHVALRAPAYTGEPERVQPDGRGGIAGLAGSLATIDITTSKPIAATPGSARILVDGQAVSPMSFVGDDPTRLSGSFRLRAGQKQYAIALVDTLGLSNSPHATYRLDVRPDRAPAVKLPEPGRSKKVTPKAIVPIRLAADDDHGVVRSRFVHQRGDDGKPVAHKLPAPQAPAKSLTRAVAWDLTALALKERETLLVHAEADDAYAEARDGKTLGPNVGRSPTYHLTIISEAEMASLLQRRQQEIKQRLRKLIERQEASKADVERLGSSETAPDRRKVQLAEREQRKIAAATTHIAQQLDHVLGDMTNNKVGTLAERRRAEALSKALRQLADADMPEAARHVANAARAADRPRQTRHLAAAATRQQQVVDDLRAALARFDQWQDVDELLRDAGELLLAQKKLRERTAELGRKLLGKPAEQLSPAEKGATRSLARAQQSARDRMQALETKMADVARKLQRPDPAAARLVEQALAQANSDQIRARMDDAASRIQQAHPASALPHQAKASDALKRLVDTLSRARSPYLARDIRKLQERLQQQMRAIDQLLKRQHRHLLESALANLRRQLNTLHSQQTATRAATAKAPSAQALKQQASPQGDHARQADSLSRQVDRLTRKADKNHKQPLAKAGQSLKAAQQQMSQAAGSLSKANQANAAQSKTAAAKAQRDAIQGLQQAQRELERLRQQLAQKKTPPARLPERAAEQGQTSKDTSRTASDIEKASNAASKTFPTTAKSMQQASRNSQQAAESMSKAQQSLHKASQQPKAAAAQQQNAQQQQKDAVDDLQRAREQLARAHDQLDLRRRVQKLFELQKALTDLLPPQVALREATQKLDAASEGGRKPFDHAQTLELRELADKQGKLHTAAGTIIAALEKEQAPVFLYVMRDASRLMTQVQQRLADKHADWLTQEAEREIERHILELLDALKSEADRLAKREQQQQQAGGGGQRGRPQPLVAPYHQLKQLKLLQLRVNEQTRALELDKTTRHRLRQRLLKSRAERIAARQREIGEISRKFGDALEKRKEQESMTPQ